MTTERRSATARIRTGALGLCALAAPTVPIGVATESMAMIGGGLAAVLTAVVLWAMAEALEAAGVRG